MLYYVYAPIQVQRGDIILTVTFLGHKNTKQNIQENLKRVLIDLIENKKATRFLVGNNGNFDFWVKQILKDLKNKYPNISYYVVLAYLPRKNNELNYIDYSNTLFPEAVARAPKKFAISYRNKWMICESEIVVVNVDHSFGGAATFKELAEKKGKIVINLTQL